MNNRYDNFFSSESAVVGSNYATYKLRPIFLFFDELIATMSEDKKLGKEIESYLLQIMLKGRQAGIFVILSSQRFSAEVLSTNIRENAGMRVALGRMSRDSYRMIFGDFDDELPSAEKVLDFAIVHGYLATNHSTHVETKVKQTYTEPVNEEDANFYIKDELRTFLEYVELHLDYKAYTLLRLISYTGMRKSEALALT